MTEPIIITAIVVGGLVAAFWIALHFGYKAWSAERADAKTAASRDVTYDIHVDEQRVPESHAIKAAEFRRRYMATEV